MNRVVGFWFAAAGLFSTVSLAQESARAFAERTCENQPDYAKRGCNNRIANIYQRMDRAFAAAHRVAPDDADDNAQQSWFADLRKHCGEWQCMQDALAYRIFELRAIEMRSYDVAHSPMTDAVAHEVCANVAASESRGDIDDLLLPAHQLKTSMFAKSTIGEAEAEHSGQLEVQFPLELRKGSPRSFGLYMGRGTCVSFSIESVQEIDKAEDLKWPLTTSVDADAQDALRLIGWGGGESVLAYRGRHYIATYGGDHHGVAYLEWLTPAGTRRGLCTFEDNGFERIVTARLNPRADCDALANTPGEEVAGPMSIDLDNDGKLDAIAVDGGDSGAGCGSSWRNIRLLTANGDGEVSSRNEALAKLTGIEGGQVMLLTLKGREYVYAASSEEVPTVYAVTNTSVVPQCEFRIQYKRRVKTQFLFSSEKTDNQ